MKIVVLHKTHWVKLKVWHSKSKNYHPLSWISRGKAAYYFGEQWHVQKMAVLLYICSFLHKLNLYLNFIK